MESDQFVPIKVIPAQPKIKTLGDFDPEARDVNGCTVLMRSVLLGRQDAFEALL